MEPFDPILNPTVFIGAFEWREPVTTLTDFLSALAGWFGFWLCHKSAHNRSNNFVHYRNYFLLFALSMTCAAWVGHGLQAYLSPRWKVLGWMLNLGAMYSLSMASLGEIRQFISAAGALFVQALALLQLMLFGALMLHPATSDFSLAQMTAAASFALFVVPMQSYNYWKTRNQGSLVIVLAVVYGLIPSFVYNNQISLSRWFNYHDISHVLVFGFMLMMIFAVRRLALTEVSSGWLRFSNSDRDP